MTTLIEHVELCTGTNPIGTVIWMHGLGADCWDFVPVIKELSLAKNLPLRFIFPQAPSRPVTINGGHVMPAWYDISMADISATESVRRPDETGIRQSQASINALIENEISRGIAYNKIVIAGFSQGGAIALQTALRHPKSLGGVLALSTYLTLASTLATEKSAANAAIPILMAHGTQDPVVPLKLARESEQNLKVQGFSVEWREYPMQHSLCGEEIEDISAWLTHVYGNKAGKA
jgi:phospholipase/carboxylesterase